MRLLQLAISTIIIIAVCACSSSSGIDERLVGTWKVNQVSVEVPISDPDLQEVVMMELHSARYILQNDGIAQLKFNSIKNGLDCNWEFEDHSSELILLKDGKVFEVNSVRFLDPRTLEFVQQNKVVGKVILVVEKEMID